MADKYFAKCLRCGGDGTVEIYTFFEGQYILRESYPCPNCSATGFIESGYSENADVNSRLDSIAENLKVAMEYLEKILANLPKIEVGPTEIKP